MALTLIAVVIIAIGFFKAIFPKSYLRLMAQISIRLNLFNGNKRVDDGSIWFWQPGAETSDSQKRVAVLTRVSGLALMIVGLIWLYFSFVWFK